MTPPNFPTPVGVLFSTQRPTIESLMNKQIQDAIEKSGPGNIDTLLRRGDVWSVE
jgi:2-oxoglutarate ferredoxin oxidoreductase subunit beta